MQEQKALTPEKSDIRAVENPITDLLNLSEKLYTFIPELRRMTKYFYIYLSITLFLLFILLVLLLVFGNPVLFLIVLFVFLVGIILIQNQRRLMKFIEYYSARHKAIKSVYEEHEVKIPEGADSIERLITYLLKKDAPLKAIVLQKNTHRNFVQKIKNENYNFDLVAYKKPGILYELFGYGEMGYTLIIKKFDNYPLLMETMNYEQAVMELCRNKGLLPSRIIILVEKPNNNLDDNVYEYIINNPVRIKKGLIFKTEFVCTMQIITEGNDNNYDFIPYVPFIL